MIATAFAIAKKSGIRCEQVDHVLRVVSSHEDRGIIARQETAVRSSRKGRLLPDFGRLRSDGKGRISSQDVAPMYLVPRQRGRICHPWVLDKDEPHNDPLNLYIIQAKESNEEGC